MLFIAKYPADRDGRNSFAISTFIFTGSGGSVAAAMAKTNIANRARPEGPPAGASTVRRVNATCERANR